MKKLLNTLFVTQPETYLHKERETIVVKCASEKLAQFPSLALGNIICFGQVSVSPFLMGHCAEHGIGLAHFTEYGRFLARIQGKETGNVLLRREQYRWADDPQRYCSIAQLIIAAKIANCKSILLRELRNHGENSRLQIVVDKLNASLARVKDSKTNLDELRGIEGEAANSYFSIFNELLHGYGFVFDGRVRRPPTDPVNALLSFAYSLVTQECVSALQGVGLDPYVGFLHRDRPGRVSLALDLLEEFRAPWADRLVLTIINRRQIQLSDFVSEASGAVRLSEVARKRLLTAYQERKQEEITHPYLQEKIALGLLPHCQAMLLARHIRGDTEYYVPYYLK